VLEVDTAEALASHHWLGISSYSVEEFLQMDYLDVREMDLVWALVRWGKFKVLNDKDDPEDGQKLRAKILPGLRYIRFASLAKAEMKTCLQLLDGVLSDEEKHLISTKKWKQLPLAVFASASAARRKKAHIVCKLPQFSNSFSDVWRGSDALIKRSIKLQVERRAELVGLNFEATRNFREWKKALNFELMDAQRKSIARGNFRREISHDGVDFVRLSPRCVLEADTKYTLEFIYCGPGDRPLTFQNYLLSSGTFTAGWLTLKIDFDVQFIEVKAISMLFVKP
jgi:hypothetical protein